MPDDSQLPASPDPEETSTESSTFSQKAEHDQEEQQNDEVIGKALIASLVLFLIIAALVAVIWWGTQKTEQETEQRKEVSVPVQPEAVDVPIPTLSFVDITQDAGIDFVHENGARGEKLLPETMGGGVAFFDADQDGDQDLLFVNSTHWPGDSPNPKASPTTRLYLNDGRGNFQDASESFGLDLTFYGMGVAVGDYDNDGLPDLYFSALGQNRLFHNEGKQFKEVTEQAGLLEQEPHWSTSSAWFDYDRDGDLDLFVCNYLKWSKEEDLRLEFKLTGLDRAYGRPQLFPGTVPYLYQNQGDGTFKEVAQETGLHVKNVATETPVAKSLGVAVADLNEDGWPDLIVANDTVQNFLFENQKDGTFKEVASLSGIAFDRDGKARGAMGVDIGRFRNDDHLGVAIGNFSNEMTALYVSPDTNLQFTDEAIPSGLGPQTRLALTFGVFFFDYDLDGRLDLCMANGHLEEDIHKVQSSQYYEQPPQLFWNCGVESKTEFFPATEKQIGPDFLKPMVGRGSAFADIDGDGDLDLVITATGQAPRLLRNDSPGTSHWLRVKLQGKEQNRNGIGAHLQLVTTAGSQYRYVTRSRSYLSQSEPTVTFGLGSQTEVKELRITWPDGSSQTISKPEPDQELLIEHK